MARTGNEDLYKVLGVDRTATTQHIRKAYRKLALRFHPDKNPDDEAATNRFARIFKAYETLSDEDLRREYDQAFKAVLQRQEREAKMDEARRKMVGDLNSREAAYRKRKAGEDVDAEKEMKRRVQEEIERFRREWAHPTRVPDEQNRSDPSDTDQQLEATVRVRWNKKSGILSSGDIRMALSVFGTVDSVVVSSKKANALVTFVSLASARMAVMQGSAVNGLRIEAAGKRKADSYGVPERTPPEGMSVMDEQDYESLTLQRMRQAAQQPSTESLVYSPPPPPPKTGPRDSRKDDLVHTALQSEHHGKPRKEGAWSRRCLHTIPE